jgi:hypothetical protein
MKKLLFPLALIVLIVLWAMPSQAVAAPDTLDVAVSPVGNINNVINGDTLAGGVRKFPDRVYRLARGSVYQVTAPIKINGSLEVYAPAGTTRPPVLAPAILSDNSSIDHFFEFIGKGGKATMTNVYLLSQRADNNWLGWSDGIRIQADSIKLKLRGCVFDGFSDAGIVASNHWLKSDVQDCIFRNHQHSSAWFGGQPFMTGGGIHQDTCKFINNTFVANNSYSWSIRGYDKWSVFEHNTMVFGTVNPFLMRQGSHMRIKNNVFYAMHSMGGNPDHIINGWFLNYPDTASSSIVRLRGTDSVSAWSKLWKSTFSGPEAYMDSANGVTKPMLAINLRKYDFSNNAYFWPTKYKDFVKAYNDTVKSKDSVDVPVYNTGTTVKLALTRKLYLPTWISKYAQWTMDSLYKPNGASVVVANNQETDPGFGAALTGHIDSLTTYIRKICTNTLDIRWAYPNNTLYPPTWPLPEAASLAYSNTAMQSAGSDGFPLGDLNWFPAKKAAWLLTGVEEKAEPLPQDFSLSQNYPNPFNPSTTIEFAIPKQANVSLKVYNMLGQEVASLVSQTMAAGHYTVDFDASKLASGAYVYRLTAGSFVSTQKMLLMK